MPAGVPQLGFGKTKMDAGTLAVYVHGAENIEGSASLGKLINACNFQFAMELGSSCHPVNDKEIPSQESTVVHSATLSPQWKEELTFKIRHSSFKTPILYIDIYSIHKLGRYRLGFLRIDIADQLARNGNFIQNKFFGRGVPMKEYTVYRKHYWAVAETGTSGQA